jgi:hypothetical protein
MNSKQNQNKQNQNKQNQSNSTTMDLEKLQQKYSNLIAQYKAAVYEYTNFLSQQPITGKSSFSRINGYAVIGNRIGFNESATLQQCEASCAKLSNCTGATFITPKGNNRGCILTGGDSKIVKDREGTYAIIPKSKQLLLNMENINQQLIATNKEIRNKIKNAEPVITENINKSSNKAQELINTYKDLTEEREDILNLLRQYETLDNVENENQIIINKNYYSYVLLSILAIAVIFLLYRVSFPPVSSYTPITPFTPNVQYSGILGMNAYFIVFILILLTIGIYYFSNIFHTFKIWIDNFSNIFHKYIYNVFTNPNT